MDAVQNFADTIISVDTVLKNLTGLRLINHRGPSKSHTKKVKSVTQNESSKLMSSCYYADTNKTDIDVIYQEPPYFAYNGYFLELSL